MKNNGLHRRDAETAEPPRQSNMVSTTLSGKSIPMGRFPFGAIATRLGGPSGDSPWRSGPGATARGIWSISATSRSAKLRLMKPPKIVYHVLPMSPNKCYLCPTLKHYEGGEEKRGWFGEEPGEAGNASTHEHIHRRTIGGTSAAPDDRGQTLYLDRHGMRHISH